MELRRTLAFELLKRLLEVSQIGLGDSVLELTSDRHLQSYESVKLPKSQIRRYGHLAATKKELRVAALIAQPPRDACIRHLKSFEYNTQEN